MLIKSFVEHKTKQAIPKEHFQCFIHCFILNLGYGTTDHSKDQVSFWLCTILLP